MTASTQEVGVEGATLAVQVAGPPGAPWLLLLPGQANSHRWWDDLRGRFETDHRTVTFDYRGTGDTRAEDAAWSTGTFAGDAVAVLDALGADTAHVYGTSMGGRVAQVLAAAFTDRVERLVLACTSPGGPHAVERGPEVRRVLARPGGEERTRAVVDLFYTPAWGGTAADSRLLGDPTMTPAAQRRHLRVSAGHDAWDRLPSIDAPTLLLHGDADRMVPVDNLALLASRVPDARTHVVPGGRHGFFDEFADDLDPVLRNFLA